MLMDTWAGAPETPPNMAAAKTDIPKDFKTRMSFLLTTCLEAAGAARVVRSIRNLPAIAACYPKQVTILRGTHGYAHRRHRRETKDVRRA